MWFLTMLMVMFLSLSSCGSNALQTTNDLKGTTWQHTKNGSAVWWKVVLHENGTYDEWGSTPSVGKWDNHCSGKYTVSEERAEQNGSRYYCVTLENSNLLVRTLCVFANTENPYAAFNDYCGFANDGRIDATRTDENPWN